MLQLPKQTELVMFNNGVESGPYKKQKSHWFAMVLNNENGRQWVKNFRNKNRHLKVTVYCRHSDRRKAFELMGRDYDHSYEAHNIPQKFAERFAVYVDKNPRRNKNVKEGEYMTFGDYGYEIIYKSGNNLVLQMNFVPPYFTEYKTKIFAEWNEKKQMWVKK